MPRAKSFKCPCSRWSAWLQCPTDVQLLIPKARKALRLRLIGTGLYSRSLPTGCPGVSYLPGVVSLRACLSYCHFYSRFATLSYCSLPPYFRLIAPCSSSYLPLLCYLCFSTLTTFSPATTSTSFTTYSPLPLSCSSKTKISIFGCLPSYSRYYHNSNSTSCAILSAVRFYICSFPPRTIKSGSVQESQVTAVSF